MRSGPIGVMHLVDSLNAGGTERVAVNLVNLLPRDRFRLYLCPTRTGGPLNELIAPDVKVFPLRRQGRFSLKPIYELAAFIEREGILILHAHSSSLFLARLAQMMKPEVLLFWHDHFGRYAIEKRPVLPYRLATRSIAGVIAVNQYLADWSCEELGVPSHRVCYLPNFVPIPDSLEAQSLPGSPGYRLVCVANLRPEKDHLTLIRALSQVRDRFPQVHLFLVGAPFQPDYERKLHQEVSRLDLHNHLTFMGQQKNVMTILAACDIGILSSSSEGLPLSLLEYGMAGLAAVATRVGQCPEVLDQGRVGGLVPPKDPAALAQALCDLLASPEHNTLLGDRFRQWVHDHYSAPPILDRLSSLYTTALDRWE